MTPAPYSVRLPIGPPPVPQSGATIRPPLAVFLAPQPRVDHWYSRPKYADPVLWRCAVAEVAEAVGEPVPDMGGV